MSGEIAGPIGLSSLYTYLILDDPIGDAIRYENLNQNIRSEGQPQILEK